MGRLIDADAFERSVMFSDAEDMQDVIYALRAIPKMQGRSNSIPKPITDCHRASKAAAFVAYLSCAVFR